MTEVSEQAKTMMTARVDPELYRNFKIACVSEGKPIYKVIEELIAEWLKKKGF